MNIRRRVALSNHPLGVFARRAYRSSLKAHVPVPRLVGRAIRVVHRSVRGTYYGVYRLFVCEPLLRASATSYGRNLRGGTFIPWVVGTGDLVFGDDCVVVGKLSVWFAARFSDRPALVVGNRTGIGHDCAFTVAKGITIGDDCHIAGGTRMFDSSGHPLDPERRRLGNPPDDADVKPIVIGNNVWIGGYCTVFPGVTIGDNSVVATGSVVTGDVPPNVLVAGYPARQIKKLDVAAPDISAPSRPRAASLTPA